MTDPTTPTEALDPERRICRRYVRDGMPLCKVHGTRLAECERDPTTPTGKAILATADRVHSKARGESGQLLYIVTFDRILAIEAEAAAAERERLANELRAALVLMPNPAASPARDSLSWRSARAAVEGIIRLVESDD